MSEEFVIKYCAPTLAGLKTGNLFTCDCGDKRQLQDILSALNGCLNEKGIYVKLMRIVKEKALIYVYRPQKLDYDLSDKQARKLLMENGYEQMELHACIQTLRKRLNSMESFPHEIGLFLGYPVGDVKGFIENHGKKCKCTGYWKVYTNECEAKKCFAKYKKCVDVYCRKYAEGVTLQRLAVGRSKQKEKAV